MNPSALKTKFIEQIAADFPALSSQKIAPFISDQLLSPFVIELPKKILSQARAFVSATFKHRNSPEYTSALVAELERRQLRAPGNYSILMSYDFHIDENENLKLIEINTNAAFLALGDLMYKTHGLTQPVIDFSMQELRQNILQELALNGHSEITQPRLAIIDDQPETQRLYVEFLVFAELFKSWGWNTQICDYRQLSDKIDFIYNRYTDFFFNDPSSKQLRELFNSRTVTFSPNPVEYLYLADKTRMIEWSQKNFAPAMIYHLPKAQILNSDNSEQIWNERKNLFFKPRQSFGSKQTYRGAKISKKLFEEITNQDFIAQEYMPAPEKSFPTESGPQAFKYDLRFFAYQDRVQSVVARIYQGQVTNLKTPLGGFACVRFSE